MFWLVSDGSAPSFRDLLRSAGSEPFTAGSRLLRDSSAVFAMDMPEIICLTVPAFSSFFLGF